VTGRIAATSLALLCLAGPALAADEPEEPKGVPEARIGLRGVSVFETAVPPPVVENTTDPGEAPLPKRVNGEVPPVVPHGVADFLPITRSSNACIDCHAVEEKEPGEPTPLPESHYRDLRNAPDVVGEAVAGARYVCVSCHVAPTSASPLVANRFGEASRAPEESPGETEGGKEGPPVEP